MLKFIISESKNILALQALPFLLPQACIVKSSDDAKKQKLQKPTADEIMASILVCYPVITKCHHFKFVD